MAGVPALVVKYEIYHCSPVSLEVIPDVVCAEHVRELLLRVYDRTDERCPRFEAEAVYVPREGDTAVVKVRIFDDPGEGEAEDKVLLAFWDGGQWLIFSDKGMAVPKPLPSLQEFRKRALRVAVVELETEELEREADAVYLCDRASNPLDCFRVK